MSGPTVLGSIRVRVMTSDAVAYLRTPTLPQSARPALLDAFSAPAEGAIVNVDLSNGERIQQVTDPMGFARLEGIDTRLGPATVTAWKDDALSIWTEMGVEIGREDLVLYLSETPADAMPDDPSRAVVITGTLTGTADRSGEVVIPGSSPPESGFRILGPDGPRGSGALADGVYRYDLQSPTRERFTAYVVELAGRAVPDGNYYEILGWSAFELGPFASNMATLDLDLGANLIEPERVTATYPYHPTPRPTLSMLDVSVHTRTGQLSIISRYRESSSAPGADVDIAFVRARPDDEVFTSIRSLGRLVQQLGYPRDGLTEVDWPEPATLTSPAEGGPDVPPASQPPDAPIRWTSGDSPATALTVHAGYMRWTVVFREGTTELTLPNPPEGRDLATFFDQPYGLRPPSRALVYVEQCETGTGVLSELCSRWATSRPFVLEL